MSDYLPFAIAVAALATVVGVVLGAFWLFFKTVAWVRSWKLPWWAVPLRVIRWFARHWRYRNQITVFKLSWFVPGWDGLYPRILLNMTENGPTSFTRQWTRNFKTNPKRGTKSWNHAGAGSMQWGRAEKEYDGDPAKPPRLTWVKTGAYADEPADEFGPFPIWEARWDGWTLQRHRRPGKENVWIHWVEGADHAHFRTQRDMLKALGWEPVINQKRHQATAAPVYEEWPEDVEVLS